LNFAFVPRPLGLLFSPPLRCIKDRLSAFGPAAFAGKAPVIEVASKFCTVDAGEAASGLLQEIESSINPSGAAEGQPPWVVRQRKARQILVRAKLARPGSRGPLLLPTRQLT
jgi:hypothetical protein